MKNADLLSELIDIYRSLSPDAQEKLLQYARQLQTLHQADGKGCG